MCNCNNTTNCGGGCLGQTPCTQMDCSCPIMLNSDCVNNVTAEMPCSGIGTGQNLTAVLEQLDAFICTKFDQTVAFFTLINVGTGSQIYKGINGVGQKEIRSVITTGTLLTNTQNTNDITLGIDEDELLQFVLDSQLTYSVANAGTGAQVYKDSTIVGNNTQFNFRSVVKQDLGLGTSFLRDIQQNTDELNVRVKTLVSDNLTITSTDDEVRIETPMTASIPALYVNNLYTPTYNEWLAENTLQNGGTPLAGFVFRGRGTLSAPFCDNTVYPLLGGSATITTNTAIQNALDGDSAYLTPYSYVGTGTRLAPERVGQKIIIQDNTTSYTFTGNFGYSQLNIEISGSVFATTAGYVVDMDNATHFNTTADTISITVNESSVLQIAGDGINNSGTNIATNTFTQVRSVNLLGLGRIISLTNDITKYIINSDITSTGNNNDGGLTFNINCDIYAKYQGIIRIGGVSRVWNFGKLQSSDTNTTIDVALEAYLFLGGQFRSFEGSVLEFAGARTNGFIFTPTGGFIPIMVGKSTSISSFNTITNLFTKTTTDNATLIFSNSDSSVTLSVTNIFESPNLWSVVFNKNVFESGAIDNTKVDLTFGNTISVTNSIGANLLEHLRVFDDRADAISAGVPLYSAYIKTNGNVYPSTATWVRDIVLPA